MVKHRGALLLLSGIQAVRGTEIGGSIGEWIPTELPRPESAFPGPTALDSKNAWPSGHQPGRYDAWPQIGYGTPNRTLLPCWKRRVLHDHDKGWPGLCMRLFNAKRYMTLDSCRTLCWNEPRCSVWQFVNQSNPGQCWVGFGTDCASRDGNGEAISVQGAQRIMHGNVRVLKNLSGWKINNLYQIGTYHAGDVRLSILRCKAWCYSSIMCQYWQYGPGGCWVDAPFWSTSHGANPENKVQYPLTTNGGASNTSKEALTMMWGEYIQHYCPPRQTTPQPALASAAMPQLPMFPQTTPAPQSSAGPAWWIWCLLAAVFCICALACAYAALNQGGGDSGSKSSKRGNRIAMTDYGEESSLRTGKEKPLMKQRSRPLPGAGAQAPTSDYLNAQGPEQDSLQWSQQSQPPPPPPPQDLYGGGAGVGRQTNLMHAPPERSMPQQGLPAPTQLVDNMHPNFSQASMPTHQGRRATPPLMQQGGMPFPTQRPNMQTMGTMSTMGPGPRLM